MKSTILAILALTCISLCHGQAIPPSKLLNAKNRFHVVPIVTVVNSGTAPTILPPTASYTLSWWESTWTFERQSDGNYCIKTPGGKYLRSWPDESHLVDLPPWCKEWGKWEVKYVDNARYKIRSIEFNTYLTLTGPEGWKRLKTTLTPTLESQWEIVQPLDSQPTFLQELISDEVESLEQQDDQEGQTATEPE
eukprot:CAMPEP_0114992888 /NCGR_PEP_ID=MMETSP0216-20121206/12206_1 /TAXON_ID=223996 /ORGANISM="Protocruzia adherens, Strain Boccale" /LENGTH=192 /DNA_ID=CAMNT_0002356433 /DNA_START=53 /DNA_END=631 /DNA_ORIENTATION=+